jgi:hypothetical protein
MEPCRASRNSTWELSCTPALPPFPLRQLQKLVIAIKFPKCVICKKRALTVFQTGA